MSGVALGNGRSALVRWWADWRALPGILKVAIGIVVVQVLVAALAPWIAPYDPLHQDILARLSGPSAEHWLGADRFGRDILSRILYGYRSSFLIAFTSVLSALLVGGTLGLLAAYYRGWIDRIVSRAMDVLFAFPIILLAIGIIAVLGTGTTSTTAAIAIVYTPIFARVVRGPALVLREAEFVVAMRSIGAGDARILLVHILPNLLGVILVQTSLLLSAAILVESSLSFLGLGTQPPTPSLGLMLVEGRNYLTLSPWDSIFAGFAILFAAFGFNFLGDCLRDQLDPRLRD